MKRKRDGAGVRRGELLELRVEKPVYRGLGLARHDGQVVFVPRAIPGDLVRARIERTGKGFLGARVEALLEPGPGRRSSPCGYAGRCGGCSYQAVDYATQLALKREVVGETLRRAGVAWTGPIEVHGSPETGWRTRAGLHLEDAPGGLRLGVREQGSHVLVEVDRCLQLTDTMMAAAVAVRDALRSEAGVEARRSVGRLGDLDLAASLDGDGMAAVLEVGTAAAAPSMASLGSAVPGLTGFGLRVPHGEGHRYVHLHGSPHLHARILDLPLRWHVDTFFQSNRFLAEPLARHVVDLVPAGAPVLDLYAGVGLFAVPLAARGVDVIAVEGSATACADLRHNADVTPAPVRVMEGDVRVVVPELRPRAGEVVVLDPPRAGGGTELMEALAARGVSTVVYVSCDPSTLARDLSVLLARGYAIDALSCWDLFPDTFHVETVVRLRRAL